MRLALLFFSFATLLFGEIREIRTISEIENHLDQETFFLFDIDNTIMEPAQTLGTDQWFHYRIKLYLDRGFSYQEGHDSALAEWMAVQNLTHVKLVEKQTKAWIEKLQNEGNGVIGLTSRGLGLATRTIEQLHSLGVDLSLASPVEGEKLFFNERGILFRKGIVFTAGTNKGQAFLLFIGEMEQLPKRVVYIDDKGKYLKEVEEICEGLNIPFVGLRYSFLDEKVKNFSPEIAAIQWEHFGKIISDEAAQKLFIGR